MRAYSGAKGRDPSQAKQRFEQAGKPGLTDEPQTNTGKRDPNLAHGQVLIQVRLDPLDELRAPVAFFRKRLHLRGSRLDYGKLRKDEKSIQKEEQDYQDEIHKDEHKEPWGHSPPVVNWLLATFSKGGQYGVHRRSPIQRFTWNTVRQTFHVKR